MTWTSLNEDNPSTLSEIANQITWNNQFICINSKSICNDRLINLGIVKIGDLLGTRGEFKKDLEPLYSTLSPVEHFFLFSLFSVIPEDRRKTLKNNKSSISLNTHHTIPTVSIPMNWRKENSFRKFKNKIIIKYENFVSKISSKATAQKRYDERFNMQTFQLHWEKIYLLPFYNTTLDNKLREFQYKILHRILYTNEMLFRFKKVDSPSCDLCGIELETVEHLFFSCTKVSAFWDELYDLLISLNLSATPFDVKDIIFGIICPKNTSILVNYIILEVKYFIYCCKLNRASLSLRLLIDKFKKTFQTERFIARKKQQTQLTP